MNDDIKSIMAKSSLLDLIQTLTTDNDDPVNIAVAAELHSRADSSEDAEIDAKPL